MYKCHVVLYLPLRELGTSEPVAFWVAEYNFDPGLAVQEVVHITDAAFSRTTRNGQPIRGDGPFFSFVAQVVKRLKVIEPKPDGDQFSLIIKLEMADKEQMPEIVRHFKEFFPGEYEDYEGNEDGVVLWQ